VRHHSAEGLFALEKGSIREYMVTWPEYKEGTVTVKFRQPSHEFTFGVGISYIPYPLVLTPVV
jgi:hypothetical protein